MRVPIFPDDLIPRVGLKRIAKFLQRKWPGTLPLQYSIACEVLAKGLGYSDYHDVVLSAKTTSAEALPPTELDVRAGLVQAIINKLLESENKAPDSGNVFRFVESLPIHCLTIHKRQSPGVPTGNQEVVPLHRQSETQHKAAVAANASSKDTPLPSERAAVRLQSVTAPINRQRPLSQKELLATAGVVLGSGSLRDQALYALLVSGIRPREWIEMKVHKVRMASRGNAISASVELTKLKTSQSRDTAIHELSTKHATSIGRYIKNARLSADAFLFPSDRDPTRPMSLQELNEICRSWGAAGAIPYPTTATRIWMASKPKPWKLDDGHLERALGHQPTSIIQHYLPAALTNNRQHTAQVPTQQESVMTSLDPETRSALEHLIRVAQSNTGQSRHIADFLLSWWDAKENGGFDPTSFWKIDEKLVADVLRLIIWISGNCVYPNDIGYGDQFRAIWKDWRGNKS